MQRLSRQSLSVALVLAALAVLAHLPALRAGFVWDDPEHITRNPQMRSLDGLARIWFEPRSSPLGHYWPVYLSALWVQYRAFGDRPTGYHSVSIALHAANVALFYFLLRSLGLGAAAVLAAALFALHPVSGESVVWATEQKNLWSTLFALAALLAWPVWRRRPGDRRYALAVALFILAMLAKTIVLALPFFLALAVWWRRPRAGRATWLRIGVLLALDAALVIGFLLAGREEGPPVAEVMPLLDRILLAGRAWWWYLARVFFPWPMTAIVPKWPIDPTEARSYLYVVGAAAACLAPVALARRWGWGAAVAIGAFTLTLGPILRLVPEPRAVRIMFVSYHHLYPAFLPILASGAWVLGRLAARRPRALWALTAPYLAFLLGVNLHFTAQFRDMAALTRHTRRHNPGSWMVNRLMARQAAEAGRHEEARGYLERAIAALPHHAQMHVELADALAALGRDEQALQAARRALAIDPANVDAHVWIARRHAAQGRPDLAEAQLRRATRTAPHVPETWFRLALFLAGASRRAEALGAVRRCLAEGGRQAAVYALLGDLSADMGDLAGARRAYHSALRADPSSPRAHNNLGLLDMQEGDYRAAAERFRRVLDIDPRNGAAHANLAICLERLGLPAQAGRHREEARRWMQADP